MRLFACLAIALLIACAHPEPQLQSVIVMSDDQMIEVENLFDLIIAKRTPYLEQGFVPGQLELLLPARYERLIANWIDLHALPEDELFGGEIADRTLIFGMPTSFGPYDRVIVREGPPWQQRDVVAPDTD